MRAYPLSQQSRIQIKTRIAIHSEIERIPNTVFFNSGIKGVAKKKGSVTINRISATPFFTQCRLNPRQFFLNIYRGISGIEIGGFALYFTMIIDDERLTKYFDYDIGKAFDKSVN